MGTWDKICFWSFVFFIGWLIANSAKSPRARKIGRTLETVAIDDYESALVF